MRGGNMELLPPVEEMEQEHTRMNATMMNKRGGAINKRIMTRL